MSQKTAFLQPERNTGVQIEIMPGSYDINDPKREYQRTVLVAGGDLRPYRPVDERQSSSRPVQGQLNDAMNCVSQSAESAAEVDTTALLQQDKLPLKTESFLRNKGFIVAGDIVNYDERMLSKESGTTPQGNTGDRVSETARKIGFAPRREYDWSKFTWSDYYSDTPDSQRKLGLEWLEHFDYWHYWLVTGSNAGADVILPILAQNTQYGAIQLMTTTHAFLNLWSDAKTKLAIEETYAPYFRDNMTYAYPMIWAKLICVTVKGQVPIPYLPYFEKKKGQAGIAAYRKATDKMVYYESGEVFQTVSGEYGKARSVDNWSREIDESITIGFKNK